MSERPNPEHDRRPAVRLEYFAANAPRREPAASRRARASWVLLALGWLPFGCGLVSSRAVARSGVPEIVHVHVNFGAGFMALGLLVSAACFVRFLRAPGGAAGAVAAAVSFALQATVGVCVSGV